MFRKEKKNEDSNNLLHPKYKTFLPLLLDTIYLTVYSYCQWHAQQTILVDETLSYLYASIQAIVLMHNGAQNEHIQPDMLLLL